MKSLSQLLRITKAYCTLKKPIRSITSSLEAPNFDLEMNRIVWIDMEMTGLDIEKDQIMEIACIVSDEQLNIIAESEDIVVHQPNEILDEMDTWCRKHHSKTGLTEACKNSEISIEKAESKILDFVKLHVTQGASPVAGNSVYMDRLFLRKYMPHLNSYFHYRIIDVSSIKELCKRWNKDVEAQIPKKEFKHRALSDIRESINELKFYKDNLFKCNTKSLT